MRVLALDSGLHRTGFALIELQKSKRALVDYGCITTLQTDALVDRLFSLGQQLKMIIKKDKPEIVVLERLFFNTNQKTAIMVAQAQGTALYCAAQEGVKVDFLGPLEIKQAITGFGNADKKQVEKMVMLEFKMTKAPEPDDVVDAIAGALAYSYIKRFKLPALSEAEGNDL